MRERPVSVTLFGILNIGLGLLGLGSALLSKLFEGIGAPADSSSVGSLFAFLDTLYHNPVYVLWNQITVPLNLAASLAMVAAGIGLLLLKNWARLTSIGCGIYKTIFVISNGVVFYVALRDILTQAAAQTAGFVLVILLLVGLAAAALSLAYPLLLIYFMTRPKVVLAFQPESPSPL